MLKQMPHATAHSSGRALLLDQATGGTIWGHLTLGRATITANPNFRPDLQTGNR